MKNLLGIPTLFLIDCPEDDSLTLVDQGDVLCDPSVKEGDIISFFYKRKEPYIGKVVAMGVDRERLVELQNRLNKERSRTIARDGSFHSEQPRKTAVHCKERIRDAFRSNFGQKSLSKSECASSAPPSLGGDSTDARNHPHQSSQGNLKPGCESDTSMIDDPSPLDDRRSFNPNVFSGSGSQSMLLASDNSDSDTIDEELTEEDKRVLAKLARKRKHADVKQLHDLAKRIYSPSSSKSDTDRPKDNHVSGEVNTIIRTPTGSSTLNGNNHGQFLKEVDQNSTPIVPACSRNSTKFRIASVATSSCLNPHLQLNSTRDSGSTGTNLDDSRLGQHMQTDGNTSDDMGYHESTPIKVMKQRRRRKPKYEKLQFEGNFYNYKENDPGVIRLSEPYNVFVSQAKLTTAKNLTCTAQAFTRRLCTLVFTQDALDHCSPTGRPATGNGRENATLRPPLDEDGVQAIVECVTLRAKKKGWGPVKRRDIIKPVGDIICELRYNKKLMSRISSENC